MSAPKGKWRAIQAFLRSLPIFVWVLYGLALVGLLLYGLFCLFPAFADGYNRYIGSVVRAFFATLTGWIPFSLAEFLLLMLPVLVAVLFWVGVKRYADSWRDVLIYCVTILSLLAYLFSVFALGFAAGYRGSSLDEKLGLPAEKVSAEDLYGTAMWLVDELNDHSVETVYGKDHFSVMPYDLNGMNDRLMAAYDKACERYPFLQRLHSRIKPVMLSYPMSYTHITGVYTFFTGEANLNVDFPDYTLPFTAAHELAHQRGIARENEANFMAFLVCMESEDPYLQYCAYLNLYDYVIGALSSADGTLYGRVQGSLCVDVRNERVAYRNFYATYQDSVASQVSGAVNNTYLTIQGTEGTKSYGMVVDLAVAYWKHW